LSPPERHDQPWSQSEDATVMQMFAKGYPPALIAANLRRTQSAVLIRHTHLILRSTTPATA